MDRSRGLLNEGGLYAERQGWHLPSYDATSWTTRAISEGLPQGSAGIGFFRTEFMLKIPDGYDVPMEFVFEDARDGTPAYRALIFVNGWMMGKRVANLGYVTPAPPAQLAQVLMALAVPRGDSLYQKGYCVIKETTLLPLRSGLWNRELKSCPVCRLQFEGYTMEGSRWTRIYSELFRARWTRLSGSSRYCV